MLGTPTKLLTRWLTSKSLLRGRLRSSRRGVNHWGSSRFCKNSNIKSMFHYKSPTSSAPLNLPFSFQIGVDSSHRIVTQAHNLSLTLLWLAPVWSTIPYFSPAFVLMSIPFSCSYISGSNVKRFTYPCTFFVGFHRNRDWDDQDWWMSDVRVRPKLPSLRSALNIVRQRGLDGHLGSHLALETVSLAVSLSIQSSTHR